MRNLFLLCISFLMMSCNTFFDWDPDNYFDLVGIWKTTMILEDGINIIEECEMIDTYEFKSDGNFIGVYYSKNGADCEMDLIERQFWGLTGDKLIIGDTIVIINIINKNKFELTQEGETVVFERN